MGNIVSTSVYLSLIRKKSGDLKTGFEKPDPVLIRGLDIRKMEGCCL
jgi:hypothetical protein